jgi:hypothetical protein
MDNNIQTKPCNLRPSQAVTAVPAPASAAAPFPLFVVGTIAVGHADRVLVEIEMEAEWVLGSFVPR